jgi:hypothetical protein
MSPCNTQENARRGLDAWSGKVPFFANILANVVKWMAVSMADVD